MFSFSCFGPSSDTIEGGAYWQALPTAKLKIYTFTELMKATGNFRHDGLLDHGASGPLFKGWVDEKTFAPAKWGCGVAVAVQRITSRSGQVRTETQSAVAFLQRLPHPNVIKLLGYCLKGKEEQLLVYEFMQKGNLDTHIFTDCRGHSSNLPITWDTRLQIAIGAARGLNFLHCAEDKIIHRDLKLKNILLDGNYNAKILDFSLALSGPTGEEIHVETRLPGTMGYLDPEYMVTGNVNEKMDVYSFGVVLLELLTGLRAFDLGRTEEEHYLVEWAVPLLPHRINLKAIIDVRMEGQYSIDAAFKAAQLTLKCLGHESQTRPSMKEVVEALERIDKMKEALKKSKIGFNQHQVRQIMNNQLI